MTSFVCADRLTIDQRGRGGRVPIIYRVTPLVPASSGYEPVMVAPVHKFGILYMVRCVRPERRAARLTDNRPIRYSRLRYRSSHHSALIVMGKAKCTFKNSRAGT